MSELPHPAQEAFDEGCAHLASAWRYPGDHGPFRRNLRPRSKRSEYRTGRRRAAEQREDLAPPDHSITSSARASKVAGTSRPSALADLRLMISSTLVTCWTGKSTGFSPLRI